MRVHWIDLAHDGAIAHPRLDEQVVAAIRDDIERAFSVVLEDPFVVNDTEWFEYANGTLKRRVTNEADYISKGFQKGLVANGWTIEKTIRKQKIDGFKEYLFESVSSETIDSASLRRLMAELPIDNNLVSTVRTVYDCNFRLRKFIRPSNTDEGYFVKETGAQAYRVGLEFETGNIASSFRAFSKLNYLFTQGLIDLAVFITSEDKSVSTRIWPSQNRNGSLQELSERNYEQELRLPALVAGFAPDDWSRQEKYLGTDARYELHEGEVVYLTVDGSRKQVIKSTPKGYFRIP